MKNLTLLAASLFGLSLAQGAVAATAEEVIAANKCTKCHTATTTKKAPSYAAVAAKWAGKPEAATILFKGLKAGGKMGDEEEHKKAEATDDEIKAVVAFVLSTK
jgi:cytochrome c551/c552